MTIDIPAARRKQAKAYDLQAASHRALAEAFRLEGKPTHVEFYESQAVIYDGLANDYRVMAADEEAA